MVRRRACCAPDVMLEDGGVSGGGTGGGGEAWVPVCFVEDDELLPTLGQRDFLLGKAFDPVTYDVDTCRIWLTSAQISLGYSLHTTFVTGVELQDGLFVRISQELPRQTKYRGSFTNPRHARDDDVGHVAILCDDLEPLDGLDIADYVVQVDWSVLFHPVVQSALTCDRDLTGRIPGQLVIRTGSV